MPLVLGPRSMKRRNPVELHIHICELYTKAGRNLSCQRETGLRWLQDHTPRVGGFTLGVSALDPLCL